MIINCAQYKVSNSFIPVEYMLLTTLDMELIRKVIRVEINKQPSLAKGEKKKKGKKNKEFIIKNIWFYWYKPFDLIINIITGLKNYTFFKMAEYINKFYNFWYFSS